MTSCVHKMCERTYGQTNMKRAITLTKINHLWNWYGLLSYFIHIWYLDWPWSEHAHIIPISRMVDFCESYNPFHVCLTIRRPHILCTQLVICLLSHFIHIWYLGWPWSEYAHIVPISWMVDFCERYSPFHVCLTIYPFAHLVYATIHLSFVAFLV
jgi:hypothetical protein